jgi:hypothetical protein
MIDKIRIKETGQELPLGDGGGKTYYKHLIKLDRWFFNIITSSNVPFTTMEMLLEYLQENRYITGTGNASDEFFATIAYDADAEVMKFYAFANYDELSLESGFEHDDIMSWDIEDVVVDL